MGGYIINMGNYASGLPANNSPRRLLRGEFGKNYLTKEQYQARVKKHKQRRAALVAKGKAMAEAYLGGHSLLYAHPVGYPGRPVATKGQRRWKALAGGIQPEWTGPETKLIKAGERPPKGIIRVTVRGKRKKSKKGTP